MAKKIKSLIKAENHQGKKYLVRRDSKGRIREKTKLTKNWGLRQAITHYKQNYTIKKDTKGYKLNNVIEYRTNNPKNIDTKKKYQAVAVTTLKIKGKKRVFYKRSKNKIHKNKKQAEKEAKTNLGAAVSSQLSNKGNSKDEEGFELIEQQQPKVTYEYVYYKPKYY